MTEESRTEPAMQAAPVPQAQPVPAVSTPATPAEPEPTTVRRKSFDFADRAKAKKQRKEDGTEIVQVVEVDLGDNDPVRVHADLDGLTVLDITASLNSGTGPQKARALMDCIRVVVIPDDFEKFRNKVAEFKMTTEEVVDLIIEIVEDLADHPTQAQAASGTGQSTTGTGSTENFSSVA